MCCSVCSVNLANARRKSPRFTIYVEITLSGPLTSGHVSLTLSVSVRTSTMPESKKLKVARSQIRTSRCAWLRSSVKTMSSWFATASFTWRWWPITSCRRHRRLRYAQYSEIVAEEWCKLCSSKQSTSQVWWVPFVNDFAGRTTQCSSQGSTKRWTGRCKKNCSSSCRSHRWGQSELAPFSKLVSAV